MSFNALTKKMAPEAHQPFVIDISANHQGLVVVLTDDNQVFIRVGVSWRTPYGKFASRWTPKTLY